MEACSIKQFYGVSIMIGPSSDGHREGSSLGNLQLLIATIRPRSLNFLVLGHRYIFLDG